MLGNESRSTKNHHQDKNSIGFPLNWFSINGQELKRGGTAPILDYSKQFGNGLEGEYKSEFRDVTINNLKTGIKPSEDYSLYHQQYQNNNPSQINADNGANTNTSTSILKNNISRISKIYSNGLEQNTKKKPKNEYRNYLSSKGESKNKPLADDAFATSSNNNTDITNSSTTAVNINNFSRVNNTPGKANSLVASPGYASPTNQLNNNELITQKPGTSSAFIKQKNKKYSRIVSATSTKLISSNPLADNGKVDIGISIAERINSVNSKQPDKKIGQLLVRGNSVSDPNKRVPTKGDKAEIVPSEIRKEGLINNQSSGMTKENQEYYFKEGRMSENNTNEIHLTTEEKKDMNNNKENKNIKSQKNSNTRKVIETMKSDSIKNSINDFTDFEKDNTIESKNLSNTPLMENYEPLTNIHSKNEKSTTANITNTQEISQNGSTTENYTRVATVSRISNRNLLSSQHNRETPVEINFEFLNELHNQRPPCRKKGPTFGLDDRYPISKGNQLDANNNQEKKPVIIPVKAQHMIIRPPSRHKTPNKALGLDLPNDIGKNFPVKNMYVKSNEKKTKIKDCDEDDDDLDDEDLIDKSNYMLKPGFIDSSSDDEIDFEGDFENFDNNMLDLTGFLNKDTEKGKENDEEKMPQFINPINDLSEIRRDIKSAHGKRIRPGQVENKDQGKNSSINNFDSQTFVLEDQEKLTQTENNNNNRRQDLKSSPISKATNQRTYTAGNNSISKKSEKFHTLKTITDGALNPSKKGSQKHSIEFDSSYEYNEINDDSSVEGLSNSINISMSPDNNNNNKKDIITNISNHSYKNRPSTTKITKKMNNSTRGIWSNNNNNNNNIMNNNFLGNQKDKSKIIITHNKSSNINKNNNNITLPFETSLGKDFVSLFAN